MDGSGAGQSATISPSWLTTSQHSPASVSSSWSGGQRRFPRARRAVQHDTAITRSEQPRQPVNAGDRRALAMAIGGLCATPAPPAARRPSWAESAEMERLVGCVSRCLPRGGVSVRVRPCASARWVGRLWSTGHRHGLAARSDASTSGEVALRRCWRRWSRPLVGSERAARPRRTSTLRLARRSRSQHTRDDRADRSASTAARTWSPATGSERRAFVTLCPSGVLRNGRAPRRNAAHSSPVLDT